MFEVMRGGTKKDILGAEIAKMFDNLLNDMAESSRFSKAETKTEMWSKVIGKVRGFSKNFIKESEFKPQDDFYIFIHDEASRQT
jgi:hypothetical protein